MQSWSNMYMMNSNSTMMEYMVFTMDHTMVIASSVITGTSIFMVSSMKENFTCQMQKESKMLEMSFFLLPTMMLLVLASASLKVLYTMEDLYHTGMSVKATGHQWYWSYDYPESDNTEYDSYMEIKNQIRLLMADNHMIMPYLTKITLMTSSEDVIHSWTVPSMGIKADAIPGRINQLTFSINRPGIFSGQCSELCGSGHSFMPITVSSMPKTKFIESINQM